LLATLATHATNASAQDFAVANEASGAAGRVIGHDGIGLRGAMPLPARNFRSNLARTALGPSRVSRAAFETIRGARPGDRVAAMRREIHAGLTASPKSIPPKYFYDEEGSRLFDAICLLPEYYLTRAEYALLESHSRGIVDRVGAEVLVEIGSGMARKTGLLVGALCARAGSPRYVAFDISPGAVEASTRALAKSHPRLSTRGIVGDFGRDLRALANGGLARSGPRLFAFLGSTIGNLDEREAPALLQRAADAMTARDAFLLGVDLVKDERVLHAAYNDAQGVTAAFNKNVLRVLSRDLDGDFDESAFEHLAFYDTRLSRIEMHLVSLRRQSVTLRAIDLRFELAAGERVMTEISRKFTRASVEGTFAEGGMKMQEWLPADDGAFALAIARRA
jgi:L-histidine N-alpha-methyltransferase